ncbi:MFS general substrate transporter [Trichoderma citrinoviride]|uniref:MFS general substrate transporter n=1 Tax=Trichoderma citrinoviride TaxID=58853 RepID=A0A2T4BJS9_9HYPO|nr:MFS general substrate transporter [Trichoderma citrinoviride]PTB69519.1 MFS general substrate transporter [Trichoderma citrinoviride]
MSATPLEEKPPSTGEQTGSEQGQSLSLAEHEPAPDGGLRAWLVAFGAASIFFCCLGFSNSFGTFTEYYLSHQLSDHSPDDVAWIGSLSAFLQFFVGMVGGPLFDRYGSMVIFPAAVLYIFAVMILSACKAYWQIMLVQGVLMGVAMAFLQFPAMASVSQYFDKKRAAALGVAISGSSIGGIVMPIAVSKMLNSTSLGFGWTVRIIGFLMLPFMAFSLAVVRPRLPPRTTSFWIASAFRDAKYDFLILSAFFVFIGMFMPIIFLPTYAVQRGMGATLAGYLPAILNGASTFGRIIPGVLADKYGRLNIYAAGSVITSVVIFCMDSTTSNAAIIVYAAVFGFTSGTLISGATVSITGCSPDPRDIGTYTGMGLALGALGALVGPPIDGAFVSHYAGFFEATMFSGAMCLFGGLTILAAKLASPQGLFSKS